MQLRFVDADSFGVFKTETVQVAGEAYDVALDVSFPKAGDAVLDFETLRVFDEKTLTCTVKNKVRRLCR